MSENPRWGYIELGSEKEPTGKDKKGQTSERKRASSRRNGQGSRGPTTPRGKAASRKNAIKHGLFTRHEWEFAMLGECPLDYELLLAGLCKQFDPDGKAEYLEVERIAACWWKLQRAWRYENSVAQHSCIAVVKERKQIEDSRKVQDQQQKAIILGLEKMVAELRGAKQVPSDLKDRFFALTSLKEQDWQHFEEMAEEPTEASRELGLTGIVSTPESPVIHAIRTLNKAIILYQCEVELTPLTTRMVLGAYVIPKREQLDTILRYETTIERSLDRALNRLERLQKMRPRKSRDSKAAAEGAETTADKSSPES